MILVNKVILNSIWNWIFYKDYIHSEYNFLIIFMI